MAGPTVHLGEEQIRQYHDRGFLRIEGITSEEEIEQLIDIYDRLFTEDTSQAERKELAATDEEGNETLPQVLGPSEYAPELLETQYYENAAAIAEQLLGEDVEQRGDHAIRKPARSGAETPWHQDEAYWDPAKQYEAMSFWLPLGEATVESGCMQFVPGSHEQAVLPHHQGDAEGLAVDDVDQQVSDVTACELPPGGATVHDSKTLHYTGPNRTEEPRRAYILGFGLPAEERDEPREFHWQEE